ARTVGSELRITGIKNAWGRIHVLAGLDALLIGIPLKRVCLFQTIELLRQKRLPTQAIAQCEIRRDLPAVLSIDAEILVRDPQRVRPALHVTLQSPDHQVRQAVDRKYPTAERAVMAVRLITHHAAPERELMIAVNHADIVG